jgi:hypothetical protein
MKTAVENAPPGWENGIPSSGMRAKVHRISLALATMLKEKGYASEKVYLMAGVHRVFVMVPRDCPPDIIGAIFGFVVSHSHRKFKILIETVDDASGEGDGGIT